MSTKIKRFTDINQFFETTGFEKRTDIDDFFVFSFNDLPKDKTMKMRPYQKDFYQISLILKSDNAEIAINEQQNTALENILYFLSPDHIFSWQRNLNTTGFIVYFKPAFLNFYSGSLANDFSFFDLAESNIIQLNKQEAQEILDDFEKLYKEFSVPNPYRVQILQSLLLSLLFKSKGFQESHSSKEIKPSKKQDLVLKFKNLVSNYYITHKRVADYADKLFVSANSLNQTVKSLTGKTAKDIIADKIIQEAKKQLLYSTEDVAEIAFNLGFEEPTHFIRFFKNQTAQTPKQYRTGEM